MIKEQGGGVWVWFWVSSFLRIAANCTARMDEPLAITLTHHCEGGTCVCRRQKWKRAPIKTGMWLHSLTAPRATSDILHETLCFNAQFSVQNSSGGGVREVAYYTHTSFPAFAPSACRLLKMRTRDRAAAAVGAHFALNLIHFYPSQDLIGW